MPAGRGGVMPTNHRLSEYDKKRIEEMNKANPAVFWILFFLIFGGLTLYFFLNSG
jgi:hypothetical protein